MTSSVAVSYAPQRQGYSFGLLSGGAYHAAGTSQELSGFHPPLRSPDAETLPARDKVVARSRDIDRNNGVVQGGVDRRVDAVVGSNVRLRARPDFRAMGQTAEWADEWSLDVEAKFRCWANDPRFLNDVERQQHFGGQVRTAYRHFVIDGEAAAPLYWIDRGGPYSTSVLVLDPDRIGNPDGRVDDENLRGGVEIDEWGAARAYWVRRAHPGEVRSDINGSKWTRIARETSTGRPTFVHVIDKRRAHQHRSIGRLASVMARIQSQALADKTELQAQITNAVFGLYARTDRSADEMRDSMSPSGDVEEVESDAVRAGFYEATDLTFDGVRVAVVPSGDKIETLVADRAQNNFVAFQNYILRAIASALGISYEQLSNDWSGINYSSARTLLNEIWRGLLDARHVFTQSFCTPIYAAWLEEAVARGLVEVPGGKAMFYVFRSALTQCEWLGPPRGSIDPLKEAKASEINRAGLVSTLEDACLELGRDYRDTLWQLKREQVEMQRYGLAPSSGGAASGPAPAPDDGEDDEDLEEQRSAA